MNLLFKGIFMDSEINITKQKLKETLSEERYIHTIGVADTAFNLALNYDYDCKKAYFAGLMHDCAKYLKDEKLDIFLTKYHIKLTEIEIKCPTLIHSRMGAILAEKEYGIKDREILNAIEYHTTGRPNMSLLEKIIFCADYIEPNRKEIPGLSDIRKTIYHNLDKAICMIYDGTLNYCRDKGFPIAEISVISQNYYLQSLNTPKTLPKI